MLPGVDDDGPRPPGDGDLHDALITVSCCRDYGEASIMYAFARRIGVYFRSMGFSANAPTVARACCMLRFICRRYGAAVV